MEKRQVSLSHERECGTVSTVEMALKDLTAKGVVDLDRELKAAMVSNLMVVLCGESEVHPVVDTVTLHA